MPPCVNTQKKALIWSGSDQLSEPLPVQNSVIKVCYCFRRSLSCLAFKKARFADLKCDKALVTSHSTPRLSKYPNHLAGEREVTTSSATSGTTRDCQSWGALKFNPREAVTKAALLRVPLCTVLPSIENSTVSLEICRGRTHCDPSACALTCCTEDFIVLQK